MNNQSIILAIDAEIKRLQEARALLGGSEVRKFGAKTKRTLSPEARKRIADAQKKRWAKAKKA